MILIFFIDLVEFLEDIYFWVDHQKGYKTLVGRILAP